MDTKESMKYKRPSKQTSVLQAKQLFRVSHFNPAGIALTSFFLSKVLSRLYRHFEAKNNRKKELFQKVYGCSWIHSFTISLIRSIDGHIELF